MEFWNMFGEIKARRGICKQAAACFVAAIQISDRWWRVHFNLGNALLSLGHTDQAIECLRAALPRAPEQSKVGIQIKLGTIYRERGELEVAIRHLKFGVSQDSTNAIYRRELGLALLAAGRTTEAQDEAREARRIDPNWALQLDREARTLATQPEATQRRPEMALKLSRLACLSGDPVAPEFLDTLAVAAAGAGKFDFAVATGEQAIQAAERGGRPELASAIAERIRLYRDHKPFLPPK